MIELFGIKNCDTVKKARKWLDNNGIEYDFVDFRQDPVDEATLTDWIAQAGEQIVNKRSTTWRQLDEADKEALTNDKILQLISEHVTLIKRPVLLAEDTITLGFSDKQYEALLMEK
ncbi:arsenate reductase [Salinibius halmophilus]|uniref:arsenate reductase n=1 Tax=Salinibius halmophilus TaxID=1853216 RepID=UPI000E66E259|nr:arsenate reductase [Salinibius halmophilus]